MNKSSNLSLSFIIAIVIAFVGIFVIHYGHTEVKTLTIKNTTTRQHISGDGENFSTYYEYLVSTDNGVYEISPSGLYASPNFGSLEEGHTYKCFIRGYAIPYIGVYPNIIDAKETDQ